MAWLVFGTFFLIDAHAPWYWFVIWAGAAIYDFAKEARDSKKMVAALPDSGGVL